MGSRVGASDPIASGSEGEGREVDVAAGAELWRGGVGARREVERCYCAGLQGRGGGYRRSIIIFIRPPKGRQGAGLFFFLGPSKYHKRGFTVLFLGWLKICV